MVRRTSVIVVVIAVALAVAAPALGASTNRRALRERMARQVLARGASSSSSSSAAASSANASGDFNNDGRKDLAVGVPGEDGDGAVQIFFGGPNGLRTDNDQIIRVTDLCGGFWANADNFGAAIAAGDFNGNGRVDLAVGAPGTNTWGIPDAGAVMIINNTAAGFAPASSCQFIYEENAGGSAEGMQSTEAEANDGLGSSLAAGNFGLGPQDDLAVGTPNEDLNEGLPGEVDNTGAVYVIFGTATGLMDNTTNSDPVGTSNFLIQDASLVNGISETGDGFGFSMAAGNLGRTSHDDLAIGAPSESIGDQVQAGVVHVLYGASNGIMVTNDLYLTQDSVGMKEDADEFDLFGFSLAIGNFGKSSTRDLAVGVPEEDVGNNGLLGGAVAIAYGSSAGVTTAGNQLFSQNSPGVPDQAEIADLFGFFLTAGNFGKSGQEDLAVGTPLESLGPASSAGVVHVLYGSASGLTGTGAQLWSQNSSGVADGAEAGDTFGLMLAAGNYGRSNHADLAIGVPGEDLVAGGDVGAVHVLSGTANGLRTTGAKFLRQGVGGAEDAGEISDRFGGGLG